MPDPIIADQNQTTPPPTFPEMTDVPSTPHTLEPVGIPPMMANSPAPKKKGRRVLLTILGIFLLIGAVGAGVVLVGQKQLFKQKASTDSWPPYGEACHSTGGTPGQVGGCAIYWCPNGCGSDGKCGDDDSGVYITHNSNCSSAETELGNYCGQIDVVDQNLAYCIPDNTSYQDSLIKCGSCTNPTTPPPGATPTPTPTWTPAPTPTPAPQPPMCSAVKAYDTNWNLLTGVQLSALSAGDTVRFTISGTPADQIDKARFTINGVLGSEITTKKPGTNEYYTEYAVPTGILTFTVTAQVHHLTLGWF